MSSVSECIKDILPEGCVLYDKDLNKVEPKEENTYYYLNAQDYSSSSYYYVGYPKNKYEAGEWVTNTAELWGRYEDEEEMKKLAEDDVSTNLVDFDFEYKGKLYGINKRNYTSESYIYNIKNGVNNEFGWCLKPKAFNTGSKMDVEIGDDLLYIKRENGDITRLIDEEYNFTKIEIPYFYTYNKYTGGSGDKLIGYNYDLQVRYKNSNEYVSYKEGITQEETEKITFEREDIVGIKLVIKDLDKTLYSSGDISVYTNVHTQDCSVGNLYNFCYLQVYNKDENGSKTLVNEPTLESYNTFLTRLLIAEYDMKTYGMYMQRNYASLSLKDGTLKYSVAKSNISGYNNNVQKERYELKYDLYNEFYFKYIKVNKDFITKTYDILPEGMCLTSTEEDIKNSIQASNLYAYVKLKDGTIFNTEKELNKYIKEHTEIEIDYNYKDSGRTKISMITNLNEIDWSYYESHYESSSIYCYINTEIPYDSIQDYGTRYDNKLYSKWNNQEYEYVSRRWFGFR